MAVEVPRPILQNKKALVVGIANEHSIAYGCAKAFAELGATLAITYLNEKAKQYVEPLAKGVRAEILMPLDVAKPGGSKRSSSVSVRRGVGSTCSCTRSLSRRRRICRAGSSTARRKDSRKRWMSHVTRSCAWRGSPRR